MRPTQRKPNTLSPVSRGQASNTLSTVLFYISIFIFIIGFNFSDTPLNGGWEQQFMPNLGGRQITDITFLDSLTGYAVTNNLSPGDTGYILKTTNRGDNWNFSFTVNRGFTTIDFINTNTGFACGGSGGGTTYLCKTINAGLNWSLVSTPSAAKWQDMSVLNNDTIWLVDDDPLTGGVYFTPNGGTSWEQRGFFSSQNPDKIYMYDVRLGFIARNNNVRRTTNGGANWTLLTGVDGFTDMYFADSLTGWKANGNMKKTTDGGLNWVTQVLPQGGIIQGNGITNFASINKDTIWANGGYVLYPNSQVRSFLNRTTDGGDSWLFQIPDTNIVVGLYSQINFTDKFKGWAYTIATGIHTTTGGDTVWYIGLQQISNAVPEKFTLKQNYPNPFNPRTVIPYSLSSSAHVKIIAYDIQGREVQKMVDNYQQAGAYEVDFMGKFTATGVYFYRMTVTDDKSHLVYTDTKKMILLK